MADYFCKNCGTHWEGCFCWLEESLRPCTNCDGRGYRVAPSGFMGVRTQTCSVCKGTGLIEED